MKNQPSKVSRAIPAGWLHIGAIASLVGCGPRQVPPINDATVPDAEASDAASDLGANSSDAGIRVCDPLTSRCVSRSRLPTSFGISAAFGYQNSTTPSCFQNRGHDFNGAEISVGPDGIYVLSSSTESNFNGIFDSAPGYSLMRNNGTSWETLSAVLDTQGPTVLQQLTVLDNGSVFALAPGDNLCGMRQVWPLPTVCLPTQTSALTGSQMPTSIRGLGNRLFGLEDTRISEYNGTTVTTLFSFPAVTGVASDFWTNASDFVVVGSDSLAMRRFQSLTSQITPVPADTYNLVAASSADDFWAAGANIQHFSGGSFVSIAGISTSCSSSDPVLHLMAHGTEVFYATDSQFGKLTVSGATTILNMPCGGAYHISDMDIRSSDGDVFLAVVVTAEGVTTCGATHLLHYDGIQLMEF